MPRCKYDKLKFEPKYFNQKYCLKTDECIKAFSDYANSEKEKKKAWKKEKKVLKEKGLTHSDYLQLLQKVFNTFIRLRDKYLPCISCGTTANVKYDCGHFWNAGNNQFLRFNEDNCHKQCSNYCNIHLSGNFGEYRLGLIEKIGIERVDWLEKNRKNKLEITIPEIKEKIIHYKNLIKQLENEKL